MSTPPHDRLVLAYFGDRFYHRGSVDDDQRPACAPRRIRGVPMMRVFARRDGLQPCPDCYLEAAPPAQPSG